MAATTSGARQVSGRILEPSGRFGAPYDDEEPDGRPVEGETKSRENFAAQAERLRSERGASDVYWINRMVRGLPECDLWSALVHGRGM